MNCNQHLKEEKEERCWKERGQVPGGGGGRERELIEDSLKNSLTDILTLPPNEYFAPIRYNLVIIE